MAKKRQESIYFYNNSKLAMLIGHSGYSVYKLSKVMGMKFDVLRRKINNNSLFTLGEIYILSYVLNLDANFLVNLIIIPRVDIETWKGYDFTVDIVDSRRKLPSLVKSDLNVRAQYEAKKSVKPSM